jgi:hypothetical protein
MSSLKNVQDVDMDKAIKKSMNDIGQSAEDH